MRYQLCCEYPHLDGLDFHIACYAQLWHLLGSALPTGISSLCGKDGDSHSRTSFQNCRKDSCLALLSHCGVLLVLHLCCTMWILGPLGVGVACTNAQSGRWGFAKALGLPYPGHTWPYGIAAYLCIPDSGDKMAIAIAAMVAWWHGGLAPALRSHPASRSDGSNSSGGSWRMKWSPQSGITLQTDCVLTSRQM